MKNLAGGATFLGTTALLAGFLFYFQPTVEAVTFASVSQTDLQQFNQQEAQTNQQETKQEEVQTVQTQPLTSVLEPESTKKSVKEANAFRATAYCLKGRTAMGGGVRRGIVAADPRVLPLGSQINIDAGSYSGTYTVADTGGAVRGRILDIWVPSCSEANRFGRRTVMVSRIGKKSRGA